MTKKTEVPNADKVAAVIAAAVPSIFDQYETDVAEQEDGRWFRNVGVGVDVKLRRFSSRIAVNNMQALQQEYRRFQDVAGMLSEADQDRMMAEHLATAVIVDWDGPAFKERDGTPIPFSVAAARGLMETLPELRNLLIMISNNIENYRIKVRKDIGGN